jgi:hypothetical protein
VVPSLRGLAVDFVKVLEGLGRFFEGRNVRYAVIGGVGIAGYGLTRATLDLDLVVDAQIQDEVVRFLESIGYETLHRSSGYSNHRHSLSEMGAIDLVYVRGETSRRIFQDSRTIEGPGGRNIPVPSPEHLVAMKVAAIKNDPSRKYQDMADVRFLLGLPGVDREAVRAQFAKHDLLELFHELEAS